MLRRISAAGAALVVVGLTLALVAPAASSKSRRDAVARLRDVGGNVVGVVEFEAEGGEVEVEVEVERVTPAAQFHGFHVHTTGTCDPNAVDPTTGERVPFFTAGGHFNPGSEIHGEHAGDLPVLLVMSDGKAEAEFETDRFSLSQLFDEDRSAVIIHAGLDNYANIPSSSPEGGERYHSHLEDVFGPDSATKETGDAGSRFACGVVRRSSS